MSVVRKCTLWPDLFVLIPGYIMIQVKLQRLFGSWCSNENAHELWEDNDGYKLFMVLRWHSFGITGKL